MGNVSSTLRTPPPPNDTLKTTKSLAEESIYPELKYSKDDICNLRTPCFTLMKWNCGLSSSPYSTRNVSPSARPPPFHKQREAHTVTTGRINKGQYKYLSVRVGHGLKRGHRNINIASQSHRSLGSARLGRYCDFMANCILIPLPSQYVRAQLIGREY